MKKIYKLHILFDAENEDVEYVKETIDALGQSDNDKIEELLIDDFLDAEFLGFLIDNGYMGEA